MTHLNHNMEDLLPNLVEDPKLELLGIGVDVEELHRLQEVLQRRPGFLRRWYTSAECAKIEASKQPAQEALLRFCLKEAVIKACWEVHRLSPAQIDTSSCNTGLHDEPRITNNEYGLILRAGWRLERAYALAWAACYKGGEEAPRPLVE